MIEAFTKSWFERKHLVEAQFRKELPHSYRDIVEAVIPILKTEVTDWRTDDPDPERIYEIDDGDYQGTLLYIVGAKGYQPSQYWSIKIGYGSCSACDTLQGIVYDEEDKEKQIKELMILALHIVQEIRKLRD